MKLMVIDETYGRPVEEWTARATPAGGGFVRAFQSLAGELSMAIALTLLEEHQGGPRNSLLLFGDVQRVHGRPSS